MSDPTNPYATEPLTDAGRIEEQGENPPMQTIRDWLDSQAAPDPIATARMQGDDDHVHVHGTPGGPFVPIPGHPEFIARHEIPEGMTPPRIDDTQAGVEAATIARMNELAAANPPPAPLDDAPLHPAAEDYARHMLEAAGVWDELPPMLRSRAVESASTTIRLIEGSATDADESGQWRLVRARDVIPDCRPSSKMLDECANILETAPYDRRRVAAWLRQIAEDPITPEKCRAEGGHYWGPLVNGRRNECVCCGFLGYTYKGA